MYCITEQQIDYILSDIRRGGVETEDLQLNLLDHICCIIEQNLSEGGNFESCYREVVRQFYKKELSEIERETALLLTFKNYYFMKSLMIWSGAFAVIAFIAGSFFKIMHWPGASALIVSAMLSFSLVFLPMLFLLKNREIKTAAGKLVLSAGILSGILYALSRLWWLQHWPGGRALWLTTLCVSFFVFIPSFFLHGYRKPETRLNTIVASILLVGVIGIEFAMTALHRPSSESGKAARDTHKEQVISPAERRDLVTK
jgi:predicted SnoaL-like aldol condensation-catalyzing enzyme